MKTTKITKLLGAAMAAAILLLNGCGGGGGGGDSSSSTPTTPTTPVVTTPTVSVTLTDVASGATTNSISLGNAVKATATVLDGNKKPVANAIVNFAVQPTGLITISPASASILSDANGLASVQLSPASISSAGAGTITATSTVDTTSASGAVNFSVGAANVGLSGLSTTTASLSPYGTTGVTVTITGVPTSLPVTVEFTSICASSGKATLTSSVQSVNGIATANYTDNKCATTDTITATVAGTSVSSSVDLVVGAPQAASIQFISATPGTIVLKGTGSAGFQESSLVKFKVVDNNNQAVANANIKLYLSLNTGGILLDGSATAISSATAITKQTTANGEVQVSVQAGTVPTPVRVNAEVSSTLKTESNQLTISTGRPAQDRFSLAVETFNIEGLDIDGETTNVTARASDRLGNPVPDGTTINFVNSGGQIEPSCQTVNGACSVKFTSANPRPLLVAPDTEPSAVAVSAGRVAILAYALGEESFSDVNNDNQFNVGEPYNDLGQAFIDRNENRIFDPATPSEESIPFDGANAAACAANQIATSPATVSRASTCDGVWGAAHVRQTNTVIMSGSDAFLNEALPTPGFTPDTTYDMNGSCETTVSFYVFDRNRNPMPAATQITTTSLPDKVTATVLNASVSNTSAPGGTRHSIVVKKALENGTCPLPASTFSVPVVVTTPKGNGTIIGLTINP